MSMSRGVAGALALLLLAPAPGRSQQEPELTLATAVTAARDRNPEAAAALLASEAAGHRAEQAGRWPNPELSAYRESFPGALPDTDQWIVSLSQRLRIGGQPGLAADAAAAEHRAAREDADAVRARLALRVQREYAGIHAVQRRERAVTAALRTTRRLLRDLELRNAEGDVSDFDVRRLRLEVEALEVQASDLRAELRGGWIRLETLTGLEVPGSGWRLTAPTAQPQGPPPVEAADPAAISPAGPMAGAGETPGAQPVDRPEVRAARQRREAAAIHEELTRREAIPDVVVTAGYSRIDPGHDGFVWSVNAVLPLFDRRRDAAAAAAAEEARLRRRVEMMENETRSERLQAMQSYRAATAALRELQEGADGDLVEMARIAYEEGAMGVVELLDAVQAELRAELRHADLERRRNDRWFVWKWASGRALEEVTR